jgi:hypothetical protein
MRKFITKLIVPLAIVGVIVLAPEPIRAVTVILVLVVILLYGAEAILKGGTK